MWDEPLQERAEAGVALLERLPDQRRVLVLADADVDGVAAATVLARALLAVGRRFRVMLSRRRDDAFFRELIAKPPDLLITADLGAAEIQRFVKARLPTIVCDHHTPDGDGDGSTVVHVNPHLVGEDGSRTASGAAVAYVFATSLMEAHGKTAAHLLPYALVGARGDRYHGGGTGGLHGRLEQGIGTNGTHARWQSGPALPDAPLGLALADTLDPFIGRLAGRPVVAAKHLAALGLDADAHVATLTAEARRILSSWLTLELLEQGAQPAMVEAAVAPTIVFAAGPFAGADMDTVAAFIDAACRADRPTDALAALLGSQEAHRSVLGELEGYRTRVREPVLAAARGRTIPLGPAQMVRIDHGRYSGCVADRIMAWTRTGSTPVIVVGPTGPRVKVSLRARSDGMRWRLDEVAEEAASKLGGVGGGHRLAAGATVPAEREAQLLEAIARSLETRQGGSP